MIETIPIIFGVILATIAMTNIRTVNGANLEPEIEEEEIDNTIECDLADELGITVIHEINKIGFYKDNEKLAVIKTTKDGKSYKNQKLVDRACKKIMDKTPYSKDKIEDLLYDVDEIICDMDVIKPEDNKSCIEILLEKPADRPALIELAQMMKNEIDIVKTVDGDYYYKKNGTYYPLSSNTYQNLISEKYDLELMADDYTRSLSSISGDEEIQQNIWEFKDNYYYDSVNKTCTQQPLQLVDRKFTYYKSDEQIPYNPDVQLYNETPTLIEQTLREVLIPKNNPEYTKDYEDFLYFMGINLTIGNPLKTILIYFNEIGNNGKTVLGKINNIIYGRHNMKPRPSELRNEFFMSRADDTNTITFDEVQENSFSQSWDTLKNITGGADNDDRKMRSDERTISKGKGTVIILTNHLPNIPLNDTALIYRVILIELPNQFVDEPTEDYQYKKNNYLLGDLEKDHEGQEWLANIIIKQAMTHKYDRPTINETKNTLLAHNKLQQWLNENLTISSMCTLTNQEICEQIENTNLDIDGNIQKIVGIQLNKVFGKELTKTYYNNKRAYNLDWRE